MSLSISTSDSTRQRLLQVLKTQGPGTVKELAEALRVTGVSVRRHLDLLAREGVIQRQTRKPKRGRPTKVSLLMEAVESLFPSGCHSDSP